MMNGMADQKLQLSPESRSLPIFLFPSVIHLNEQTHRKLSIQQTSQ